MDLGRFLALICIFIGFFTGASNGNFVFAPIDWFVAAIAIILTLGGVALPVFHVGRKEKQ